MISIEDVTDISDTVVNSDVGNVDADTHVPLDSAEINENLIDLIHSNLVAYSERRCKAYMDMLAIKEWQGTFVPVFQSNRKPSSKKDDRDFMMGIIDIFVSKQLSAAEKGSRLYGMSFRHNPTGSFISEMDTDSYAYDNDNSDIQLERLLSESKDSVYEGDRVSLIGGMFFKSPPPTSSSPIFNADAYFEDLESIKNGDEVIIIDAKGMRHELVVKKKKKGSIFEFDDLHRIDCSKLTAFVYPTTSQSQPSRRNIQDSHIVFGNIDRLRNIGLTPRETLRRLKNPTIKTVLDLIERDCGIARKIQKGGSNPKRQENNKHEPPPKSEWDVAVTEVSKKKGEGQQDDLKFVSFEDGTRIAFGGNDMMPQLASSTWDDKLYPAGIKDLRTLFACDAPPQEGKFFLYLSYPFAGKVVFEDSKYIVKSLIAPKPLKIINALTASAAASKNSYKKLEANNFVYTAVMNANALGDDEDDEPLPFEPSELGEDPKTVADPRLNYRILSSDIIRDLKIDHYAAEPILMFLGTCGIDDLMQSEIETIIQLSDSTYELFSDIGVEAMKTEIAAIRVMNLRKMVQRYIKESQQTFPTAWGKDARVAIRSIENIVQRDSNYGGAIESMNRRSVRDKCIPFIFAFAANLIINILSRASRFNPKSARCKLRGNQSLNDLVTFFACCIDLAFPRAQSSSSAELKTWFDNILSARPNMVDKIKSVEARNLEIRESTGFQGTVDSLILLLKDDAVFPAQSTPIGSSIGEGVNGSEGKEDSEDSEGREDNGEDTRIPDRNILIVKDDDNNHSRSLSAKTFCSEIAERSSDAYHKMKIMSIKDMSVVVYKIQNAMDSESLTVAIQSALDIKSKSKLTQSTNALLTFIKTDIINIITDDAHRVHSFSSSEYLKALDASDRDSLALISRARYDTRSNNGNDKMASIAKTLLTGLNESIRVLNWSGGGDLDDFESYELNIVLFYVILSIIVSCMSNKVVDIADDIDIGAWKTNPVSTTLLVKLAQCVSVKLSTVEELRKQVEIQRETYKQNKLMRLDRLSHEDRRIALLLRDTFGDSDASGWDKFVDDLPDDDASDRAMAFDSDFVVVDVADANASEATREFVDPDQDDDEVDEDVY